MAASLSPLAGASWQYFTNQGAVLAGGLLFTFQAGSTTSQATWTDSTQSVQNPNPIVLDSAGRVPNEVWLAANVGYKFVLKDSTSNTLGTWDNIQGIVTSSSSVLSEWVASGFVVTFASTSSFTVPGNQTATFTTNRRIQFFLASGTFYGYVTSSSYNGIVTTVNIAADSTLLDATLQSVSYAALNAVNPSVPQNYLKSGSPIDGSVIGGVTPAAGTFTTLTSNNVNFTGGTITGIVGFSVPDFFFKAQGII